MTVRPADAVQIRSLTRRFDAVQALDGVSLEIAAGEFFSLLGPSGCGKTTLLRLIAGLEAPDTGTVHIGGMDATELPAYRRPVNTVFQSYALFPHLNVWDNAAFGLKMKKLPGAEIKRRVDAAMELVRIGDLTTRKPGQLSGGQKQRVALARAIVNEPKVLLLDEPLAALDLKLRKELQLELRSLQRRLGITFIYVTHDQEEALVLSDRVAVMRQGKIEQVGTPQEIYERPRTRFVSQFLGSCTLLEAAVAERTPGGVIVQTPLGRLRLAGGVAERTKFTVAIRPEKVQLLEASAAGENVFAGMVEQFIYAGAETHYQLRAGETVVRAERMNSEQGAVIREGQKVVFKLPAESLTVLDD